MLWLPTFVAWNSELRYNPSFGRAANGLMLCKKCYDQNREHWRQLSSISEDRAIYADNLEDLPPDLTENDVLQFDVVGTNELSPLSFRLFLGLTNQLKLK